MVAADVDVEDEVVVVVELSMVWGMCWCTQRPWYTDSRRGDWSLVALQ